MTFNLIRSRHCGAGLALFVDARCALTALGAAFFTGNKEGEKRLVLGMLVLAMAYSPMSGDFN
jgi:hypothetical protein